MENIRTRFKKGNIEYELIAKHHIKYDNTKTSVCCIAIFKGFSLEGKYYVYEVQKVRKYPELYLKNGKVYGEYKYPSDEEFGKYGFSYSKQELAVKKYNEIIKHYEVKQK